MQSAVKQLREVDIATNGNINLSIDESEKPSGIVDSHGDALSSRRESMIARLDASGKEAVTLTRGTLWFVGVLIGVVPIIVLIAAYVVSVAMGYQGNLSQVKEIDGRVTKLENAFAEVQSLKMTVNSIQNDVGTIRTAQKESDQDRKEILKSMGDIRILLAQKEMGHQ